MKWNGGRSYFLRFMATTKQCGGSINGRKKGKNCVEPRNPLAGHEDSCLRQEKVSIITSLGEGKPGYAPFTE